MLLDELKATWGTKGFGKVLAAAIRAGLTYKQIGDAVGISPATVSRHAIALGFRGYHARRLKLKVLRLRAEGKSLSEIAAIADIDRGYVSVIIRKAKK